MSMYASSETLTAARKTPGRLATLLTIVVFFSTQLGGAELGSVVGEVYDTRTKQSLSGARVSVAGSDLVASTDSDGRFRLNGIPTGSQTVTVTYLGAKPASEVVVVTEGQTKTISVGLGTDAVQLEAFVVSSFSGPQVQAL